MVCADCCACSSLTCVLANELTAIPLSRSQSAVSASSLKFLYVFIQLFSDD